MDDPVWYEASGFMRLYTQITFVLWCVVFVTVVVGTWLYRYSLRQSSVWINPAHLAVGNIGFHHRVRQSARLARATLENTPVTLPQSTFPQSLQQPKKPEIPRIPLRYAAHLFVMLLVVVVSQYSFFGLSWFLEQDEDTLPINIQAVETDRTTDVQAVSGFSAFSIESSTPVQSLTLPSTRQMSLADVVYVETHVLSDGETLGSVANQYGVSVNTLFWSNALQDANLLAVGQELRIPRLSGVPYTVEQGDTVASIADAFEVDPEAIVSVKGNALAADQSVLPGRELFIPGAVQAYPSEVVERYGDEQSLAEMRAVLAGVVRETQTNMRTGPDGVYARVEQLDANFPLELVARHADWIKVNAGSVGSGWVHSDLLDITPDMLERLPETDDFPPPPPVWVWPTQGRFTSGFGYRTSPFPGFHNGIDIANRSGTPILAARAGQVVEAGWCGGYGYCVRINHGDGVETIYGHLLRQPVVSSGQSVDVSQVIGAMGSTYGSGGYSTGVHLHFTVKVNGQAVNPLQFLP